ncbi:hypothetical protein EDD11_009529 [Mortierella claussenii]|nr:hypothetical protein EDD11_009529 [Mortierella claussenii]
MTPSKRRSGAGSDSDMDLSSGSDHDRAIGDSTATPTTRNNSHSGKGSVSPSGDDMQRGIDFIGFEISEDEGDPDDVNFLPRSKTIPSKDHGASHNTNNTTAAAAGSISVNSSEPSHGKKRSRAELSDNDEDDEDGPVTGPPPGCPWMGHRKYSKMPSVPMMLTQELKDFVEYISPTREEHQVRKYVFQIIEQSIAYLWRDVRVVVFGSYETKLYLPSSDMDIVVLRDREFQKNDFYKLGNHLRNAGIATDLQVIAKARVPIIKFKEVVSGIAVDVSFNAMSGIQSAKVVTQFLNEIPVLRPLTMLIKHFLMIKNHNEVFMGGIGSYTTIIMILSFLQMHPQIQTQKMDPEENLGVLLIEFFELYGICFNYAKVGLNVREGGSYFEKHSAPTHGRQSYGRGGSELLLSCIDPNDPDNDTGKSSYNLRKIREVFVGAYGTLTNAVQKRHRELFTTRGDRRQKRGGGGGWGQYGDRTSIQFDEHNRVPADSTLKSSGLHHNMQVSLIKDVLTVPREVMTHRRRVEEVFYRGDFQEMFGDPTGIQGLDKMDEEGRWQREEFDVEKHDEEQEDRVVFKGQVAKAVESNKAKTGKTMPSKGGRIGSSTSSRSSSTDRRQNSSSTDRRQNSSSTDRRQNSSSNNQGSSVPLRDVEFVTVDDSDDDDDAEDGEYFENLMKRAKEEYGEDEDNHGGESGQIKDQDKGVVAESTKAGHRNPYNVNASEDSIQLPQLVSIPRHGNSNSSRNEQLLDGGAPLPLSSRR